MQLTDQNSCQQDTHRFASSKGCIFSPISVFLFVPEVLMRAGVRQGLQCRAVQSQRGCSALPASSADWLVNAAAPSLPPEAPPAQRAAMESQGSRGTQPWPSAQAGLRLCVHPGTAGGKWLWIPQNTHRLQLPTLPAGLTRSASPLQVPRNTHRWAKAQSSWSLGLWGLSDIPWQLSAGWDPVLPTPAMVGEGHHKETQACSFCPCFKSRDWDNSISSYKPVTSGLPSLTINFLSFRARAQTMGYGETPYQWEALGENNVSLYNVL